MKCPVCFREISDTANFCPYCGSKMKKPGAESSAGASAAASSAAQPTQDPLEWFAGEAEQTGSPSGAAADWSEPFDPFGGQAAQSGADYGQQSHGQQSDAQSYSQGDYGQSYGRQSDAQSYSQEGYGQQSYAQAFSEQAPVSAGDGVLETFGEDPQMVRAAVAAAGDLSATGTLARVPVLDFLRRMFTLHNLPVLIYLLINVFLIGGISSLLFQLPTLWGLVVGLLLYGMSLSIALSPIGEAWIRFSCKVQKVRLRADVERLEPIFNRVYARARQRCPGISEDVRLFINEDRDANAFAAGRETICVTRGLLQYPDEVIEATLGHEFGHLAHKDTYRSQVVIVGNFYMNLVFLALDIGILISRMIGDVMGGMFGIIDDNWVSAFWTWLFNYLISNMMYLLLRATQLLWSVLGKLLVYKNMRSNEYQADAFSCSLGYGRALCAFMAEDAGYAHPSGAAALLMADHPASSDRIERMVSYGVQY